MACAFRSARKRSNVMPLWHAAPPRGAGAAVAATPGLAAGAAVGLSGAAIGLAGTAAGWADACCGPHASVKKMAPGKNRVVENFRMRLPIRCRSFLPSPRGDPPGEGEGKAHFKGDEDTRQA